jgi:hypothetical protein
MTDEASKLGEAEQGTRLDWRTGRPMVQHDQAFWLDHERQRVAQGQSIPRYCKVNGLALSTYRHRVFGKRRSSSSSASRRTPRTDAGRVQPNPGFVAVAMTPTAETSPTMIEIEVSGMTLRLRDGAAERVLDEVLRRLA